MRKLYTTLLYCATPFLMLRLLWRSKGDVNYRKRWRERFGYINHLTPGCDILIHAVSVGEVMTAVLLIKRLLQQDKSKRIVVTTTTPTGSARAIGNLGNLVSHAYMPYDYPRAIERFFQYLSPKLVIIMETELWPNLLHYCSLARLPVLLANARLSERSERGYRKIKPMAKEMVRSINLIAAQNALDAQRFIALGADTLQIKVSGNIKFDIVLDPKLEAKGSALRKAWGERRPVWVAGSTHEGEDEQILQAYHRVKQQIPEALLILVPRHPRRFKKVASLCRENGFTLSLRTSAEPITDSIDILLVDTMGELLLFYATADVVFVGGSLVEQGGHNILEPAALGLPIMSGPHVFNFAAINELFAKADAIHTVTDWQSLVESVVKLLSHPNLRHQLGEKARRIVVQNRGAIDKHLGYIKALLGPV